MQAAHGFVAITRGRRPWVRSSTWKRRGQADRMYSSGRLEDGLRRFTCERRRGRLRRPIRDLVRFANLPVDTDFSVFRDPTLPNGNLHGVDIASMLDGYSTTRTETLRTGSEGGRFKRTGENAQESMFAFARELQLMPVAKRANGTSAMDVVRPGSGTTFFDLYGALGVTLGSRTVAMVTQFAPLVACVIDISRGASYRKGTVAAAKSWGLAAVLPAALGASRAVVTGRPLVWFGKPLITLAFLPSPSLAAVLMPYVRDRNIGAIDGARGAALVTAFVAAVAGFFSAASGYLFAAWSVCIITTSLVVEAMPTLNQVGWATVPLLFTRSRRFPRRTGVIRHVHFNQREGRHRGEASLGHSDF